MELTPASFDAHKQEILAVEQERYGAAAQYPPDVLPAGRRPLLQFPLRDAGDDGHQSTRVGVA